MRRFIKIVFSLLLLLIVVVLAAPFVVPVSALKDPVLQKLEAATGRKVNVGKVSLSVYPDIALEASDVTVSNPAWANGGNMADIKTLRLGVALMPLLHKEVHLKELTLEKPVITLIKRSNEANWNFAKAENQAARAAQEKEEASAGASEAIKGLYLGRISIKGATITYREEGKPEQTLSGLDLTLKMPNPQSEASADVNVDYNGKKISLAFTLAHPLDIMSKTGTGGSLKAKYDTLAVAWTGTLALGGKVPVINGTLDIPELDTKALATQNASTTTPAPSAVPAGAAQAASHWSDAPIKFDALKGADADLAVTIGKLVLEHTALDTLKAQCDDGRNQGLRWCFACRCRA
jgi:AsmA protein